MALNNIVDTYWEDHLTEDELIEKINALYLNNKSKILKDNDFTTVLRQKA